MIYYGLVISSGGSLRKKNKPVSPCGVAKLIVAAKLGVEKGLDTVFRPYAASVLLTGCPMMLAKRIHPHRRRR